MRTGRCCICQTWQSSWVTRSSERSGARRKMIRWVAKPSNPPHGGSRNSHGAMTILTRSTETSSGPPIEPIEAALRHAQAGIPRHASRVQSRGACAIFPLVPELGTTLSRSDHHSSNSTPEGRPRLGGDPVHAWCGRVGRLGDGDQRRAARPIRRLRLARGRDAAAADEARARARLASGVWSGRS